MATALTDKEKLDTRRFAGYPALGDIQATDGRDVARSWIAPATLQTLAHRLDTLRPEEITVLRTKYLTPLNTLEDAILTASDNLDTASASVWKHNPHEVADRTALFNNLRRRMCEFLGMAPGPSLAAGGAGIRLMRG